MQPPQQVRYCHCGTRLARDNRTRRCRTCQRAARDLRLRPPSVPAEFWHTDHMRDALASWHMGKVMRAFRTHSHHGVPIPQEIAAGWVHLTQAQLSRIETGPAITDLTKLTHWARTLAVPSDLLWFKLAPREQSSTSLSGSARSTLGQPSRQEFREADDMNRRELLRLMSMAGTLVAASSADERLDLDRLEYAGNRASRLDQATLDEYAALNTHLWRVFSLSRSKGTSYPVVREQLDVLVQHLQQSHGPLIDRRLHELTGDLFQLSGEIFFDDNRYTEAAHYYTLAATASREAGAFDLWACALTRHAFISVYERQFAKAAPVLHLAASLARRGDTTLSTRYWISTVQAQASAGLGELGACRRALEMAEHVHTLNGVVHNGGWLRFDGSRLAEEAGACYVELRRPDLAEASLTAALSQNLSLRRRGGVLTDLAMVGLQRRDVDHLISNADAALDTARQTCSGVIGRKLRGLQSHLTPMLSDRRVHRLSEQIRALSDASRT